MQRVEIDWARATWQEACATVERFTDRLGSTVDEGIFETVVVLNLLELHTFQSCEGHLDHGCPYPWVTIIDPERTREVDRKWLAVCELEELAKEAATEERYDQYLSADIQLQLLRTRWEREDVLFHRLITILDSFYAEKREQTLPERLVVKQFQPGTCRIAPGFSASAKAIPNHLKATYLARSQAEMQAFTRYLERQWQQSRDRTREGHAAPYENCRRAIRL